MNILDNIVETKRREMEQARALRPYEDIVAEAGEVRRPVISFAGALSSSPAGIIAEFKRRSPSRGFIKEGADVRRVVEGYTLNGAAAISVLTDRDYFAGSLGDLASARTVTGLPLLRKDFIIDPYQICEARIAGADVILLIAAAMTPERCVELASFAASLGLEVLLEVHNEPELGHINPFVNVVGINNRDLTTFVTDTGVSKTLGSHLPGGVLKISESGISSPTTVTELREEGFRGFLMGENFMKQDNPGEALGRFLKALKG